MNTLSTSSKTKLDERLGHKSRPSNLSSTSHFSLQYVCYQGMKFLHGCTENFDLSLSRGKMIGSVGLVGNFYPREIQLVLSINKCMRLYRKQVGGKFSSSAGDSLRAHWCHLGTKPNLLCPNIFLHHLHRHCFLYRSLIKIFSSHSLPVALGNWR